MEEFSQREWKSKGNQTQVPLEVVLYLRTTKKIFSRNGDPPPTLREETSMGKEGACGGVDYY